MANGKTSGMTTERPHPQKRRRRKENTFWQALLLALTLGGYVFLVGLLGRLDAADQCPADCPPEELEPRTIRLEGVATVPPLRVVVPPLAVTPVPLAYGEAPGRGNTSGAPADIPRPVGSASPEVPGAPAVSPAWLPPPPLQWQPLPTVVPTQPMPVFRPAPVVRSRGS